MLPKLRPLNYEPVWSFTYYLLFTNLKEPIDEDLISGAVYEVPCEHCGSYNYREILQYLNKLYDHSYYIKKKNILILLCVSTLYIHITLQTSKIDTLYTHIRTTNNESLYIISEKHAYNSFYRYII